MGGQMPVPHNTDDFSALIGGPVKWISPSEPYGSDPNMFIAVPGLAGDDRPFVPEAERALCSFVVQQATPSDCAILLGVPYFDRAE
jgi:hypothetical protein